VAIRLEPDGIPHSDPECECGERVWLGRTRTSHLMGEQPAGRPVFKDSSGAPDQIPVRAHVVPPLRSDLEEDLILRLLPGSPLRHRREATRGFGPS